MERKLAGGKMDLGGVYLDTTTEREKWNSHRPVEKSNTSPEDEGDVTFFNIY